MNIIGFLPAFLLVLSGLLAGALGMHLKSRKDKAEIQQLLMRLAIAEEQLALLRQKEAELKETTAAIH
jgi:hypothetical protein